MLFQTRFSIQAYPILFFWILGIGIGNFSVAQADGKERTTVVELIKLVNVQQVDQTQNAEKLFSSLPKESPYRTVASQSLAIIYIRANRYSDADRKQCIEWLASAIGLLLYLGIGTLYGFVLQLSSIVIGWEGEALGASAAIFGLLALCVAWAPANEFTIVSWFGMRPLMLEISILMYGFFFLAQELIFFGLQGFTMSSELLHIMGFVVALPIGLGMVRLGYVDCEGWDLFSFLNGKTGGESTVGRDKIRAREKKAAAKLHAENVKANLVSDPGVQGRQLQAQVEQAIDQGEFSLAVKLQNRISASNAAVGWKQNDLYRVIQGLLRAKSYAEAIPLMERHIETFDEHRFSIQLLLIKIWLQDQRPRKALGYMQGLNHSFLSPEQMQQLKQLAVVARSIRIPQPCAAVRSGFPATYRRCGKAQGYPLHCPPRDRLVF